MSLLRRMTEAVYMLHALQDAVRASESEKSNSASVLADRSLVAFLYDAKRFVLFCRNGVEQAPLQIYESALLFAPTKSIVRQHFSSEHPVWISRVGQFEEKIWDACIQVFGGHSYGVTAVAFSPDGKLLASADDKMVHIWDVMNGSSVCKLVGFSHEVKAVAFSPDGKIVTATSADLTVRSWDTTSTTGSNVYPTSTGDSSMHSLDNLSVALDQLRSYKRKVCPSPDKKLIATISGSCIIIWDRQQKARTHELVGHTEHIGAIAFSLNGEILASASHDKTVRLWDITSTPSTKKSSARNRIVSAVAFSPDGNIVVSGSDNGTVSVWDTMSGTTVHELVDHHGKISAIAFSPDGKTVVSGSDDRTARLWNPKNGNKVHQLVGHSHRITVVAFSPDGTTVASGSHDDTVRLWDAKSGINIRELVGHTNTINAVAFSPDGKLVASASTDCSVRLWDVFSGSSLHKLVGHSGALTAVAFSLDGKLITSASVDAIVYLWDVANGMSVATLRALSLNGDMFRLWDTKDGALPCAMRAYNGSVISLPFSNSALYTHSYHYIDSMFPSGGNPKRTPSGYIISENWLYLDRKRMLWIPPQHSVSCSAFYGNMIVLGHDSGDVSFFSYVTV